jgi:xylulokinase
LGDRRVDQLHDRSLQHLAGIPEAKLPHLMHSHERVGRVLPVVADELGVPSGCSVLCGGNDAELAALSGGLTEPGDINIISGTCDMANVCTDRPAASPDFNVHGHVVPGRWLTFFVLNAGGAALDWLRRIPCSELILETTREDLLLSLVRGNATYLGENLKEVTALVRVGRRVGISGGGSGVRGMLEARRRWTGEYEYVFQDQSSLLGAAILGQMSQLGRLPGSGQVTAGDI